MNASTVTTVATALAIGGIIALSLERRMREDLSRAQAQGVRTHRLVAAYAAHLLHVVFVVALYAITAGLVVRLLAIIATGGSPTRWDVGGVLLLDALMLLATALMSQWGMCPLVVAHNRLLGLPLCRPFRIAWYLRKRLEEALFSEWRRRPDDDHVITPCGQTYRCPHNTERWLRGNMPVMTFGVMLTVAYGAKMMRANGGLQ